MGSYISIKYVQEFKEKLQKTGELARESLKVSQTVMKAKYDRKAKVRSFEVGNSVLLFLLVHPDPLLSKYFGPYVISERKSDVTYTAVAPGQRKTEIGAH